MPLEELRARVEYHLKRMPRVYRIDWLRREPYVARISMHREVYDEVVGTVRDWGAEVRREIPVRPPMRAIEVDFSRATPPPMPLPPEVERYLLWSKFSAILSASGLNPEEYRGDFEAVFEATRGLPIEERQRRIERLARSLIPPPPPPVIPVPREIMDRLERIESELREVREAVAWRPRTARELRMAIEATMLIDPAVTLQVDEYGHPYWGPTPETLTVLKSILDRWAIEWFTHCPTCRMKLPGGALSPRMFVEHLIRVEGRIPPIYQDWLRRFARVLEEAERRGL